MKKTRRGKLSLEKRKTLEQWDRFPALSIMYESPEQYAAALAQIDARVKADEDKEEIRRLIGGRR